MDGRRPVIERLSPTGFRPGAGEVAKCDPRAVGKVARTVHTSRCYDEDDGWLGLALPKLQERYAPVPATLILDVVWALWHLPLLATGPTTLHGLAAFVDIAPSIGVRILNIVGVAFILTWIYNETGSVLLAILAHTGFNTANSTLVPLPLDVIRAEDSPTTIVITAVAIWVIVAVLFVPTRGQFGY